MNTKIIIAIICILGILAGIIGYVTYTRNNENTKMKRDFHLQQIKKKCHLGLKD